MHQRRKPQKLVRSTSFVAVLITSKPSHHPLLMLLQYTHQLFKRRFSPMTHICSVGVVVPHNPTMFTSASAKQSRPMIGRCPFPKSYQPPVGPVADNPSAAARLGVWGKVGVEPLLLPATPPSNQPCTPNSVLHAGWRCQACFVPY